MVPLGMARFDRSRKNKKTASGTGLTNGLTFRTTAGVHHDHGAPDTARRARGSSGSRRRRMGSPQIGEGGPKSAGVMTDTRVDEGPGALMACAASLIRAVTGTRVWTARRRKARRTLGWNTRRRATTLTPTLERPGRSDDERGGDGHDRQPGPAAADATGAVRPDRGGACGRRRQEAAWRRSASRAPRAASSGGTAAGHGAQDGSSTRRTQAMIRPNGGVS